MSSLPNGILIIKHEILDSISDTEIIEAMPKEYSDLPRHTVSIIPEKIKLGESKLHYWPSLLAEQEKIFNEKAVPLLKQHEGYRILYFGLAPIPLAIHLGYCINSFGRSEAFLRHHDGDKSWKWRSINAGKPQVKGVPQEIHKSDGEVVIRVGTRFHIQEKETAELIADPDREIEIYPPTLGQDIFGSFEQLAEYAATFSLVLDRVKDHLPEAQGIHLFAAVPVGLAFLMGQEINPNAHHKVHVYEYVANESSPYQHAFIVNEERNTLLIEISDKERQKYERQRQAFKQEQIEIIQEGFFPELKESGSQHWFSALSFADAIQTNPFDQVHWNDLVRLDKAGLTDAFLELNKVTEEDEKNNHNDYFFDDILLKQLNQSLRKQEDLEVAFRLYCFRESIHHSSHGINVHNVKGVAHYPRSVEETDYQADVYALLHEFAFQKYSLEKAAYHFSNMIHILTETMWAFDKQRAKSDAMEVNRVNRYLVWYYLLCRIQKCTKLEEILSLLASKPIIELRLQSLQSQGGKKVVFKLDKIKENELGICILNKGRLEPFPNQLGILSLTDLVEGLRNHEPEKIKEVMSALCGKLDLQITV
jgi:glucan-binding YG repeat protein